MQQISKGVLLSDRFEIQSLENKSALGQIYKATDRKTGQGVGIRVIPITMLTSDDVECIKGRVQQASALTHRNVRATFGMGLETDFLFVAVEWIDGHNLQSLLKKRAEANKRFSFKGAYNIVGHVCNALKYAHAQGVVHGAINPRAIIVNNAGRVKLHDWALSSVRIAKPDYAGRQGPEISYWAPEVVKRHSSVSARSDVYSLGALFYVLICGREPERPLRAPSKLGFSKDVDSVIARCMSADPRQRFATPEEVKRAISQLAREEAVASDPAGAVDDSLGIDIDVDMDLAASDGAGGEEGAPQSSAAGGMLSAEGLPPAPGTGGGRKSGNGPELHIDGRVSTIDMGAVLSTAGQSEVARWMVQKDKFDHGPFSDRELVQMILSGDVLGNHKLTNMDTGERKKVRSWGEFDDYLEAYRVKKTQQEEDAALKKTEQVEKTGLVLKLGIAAGFLVVVGLSVGGYFLSRKLREEKVLGPQEMVSAFDSGEIQIKMTGDDAPGKRTGGKSRKGSKKGARRQFADGLSYEEAMNRGVALGDLNNQGGQRLTAGDINAIMRKNVRKFLPCMSGESVKRVDMDIAVGGDGRVIGVSVKQGSGKMQSCVSSRVRSIKFPKSNQPRTATSWYFELY